MRTYSGRPSSSMRFRTSDSNGHLGRLTPVRARAQRVADHPLQRQIVRLDQGAPVVAGCLLPAHAAVLGDELQMPVALRRRGLGRLARHRARARWHDDRRIGMACGDLAIDIVPVERTVGGERGDRARRSGRAGGRLASHRRRRGRSAPTRRSGRCRRPCRGAASSRTGASCCRASRPATRPGPHSRRPVLSTSRCTGPEPGLDRGRGTSRVSARRLRVEWSGTARSSPSRRRMEPISPSVWRSARRNTARSVSAVRIASAE